MLPCVFFLILAFHEAVQDGLTPSLPVEGALFGLRCSYFWGLHTRILPSVHCCALEIETCALVHATSNMHGFVGPDLDFARRCKVEVLRTYGHLIYSQVLVASIAASAPQIMKLVSTCWL